MKILFITDPLIRFKIAKDTTFAMMEELAKRGHCFSVAEQHALSVEGGRVLVEARELTLTGQVPEWFRLANTYRQPLTAFNMTIMRKDPPFDLEYLYTTQLFSLAQTQGAKIFASGAALRNFNEKLAILSFPEWIPPTLVSADPQRIRSFVNQHHDVILKPLDSMGGDRIFRLHPDDPNGSVILETITQYGKTTIMAQRYIPEISEGDKRIIIIGGKPIDFCLARIPKAGETRGNLAAGGRGEARPLTAKDREIAEAVGPQLLSHGILLAGLDVIGDYLTEINITSPTCFREIMDQTGVNVAASFVDALEKM